MAGSKREYDIQGRSIVETKNIGTQTAIAKNKAKIKILNLTSLQN